MKRGLFLLAPMALAAIVFAQETEDTGALVKQLGSEDYAVREAAQKKLVEMGEKAVPALEEALKSEDLEVRLRAGRALRAIGGARKADDAAEEPATAEPQAPQPRGRAQGMSVMIAPGKVTVTITEMVDGKPETKTYEGASVEELMEKHPELKQHLDGRLHVGTGNREGLDMDMDRFWNNWTEKQTGFDEDIRKWQEESRRQMEAMRKWMEQYRPQRRGRPEAGLVLPGAMLGVRAYVPPAALDAQLDLRGTGLVIEAIEKGSLADRLGLERYDVLVELNGREIRSADDVSQALHGRGDAKAAAKVVRRAQPLTLSEATASAPR